MKQAAVLALPTVTLRKSLASHMNICSGLKLNPASDNELFSCSFDCTVIKWDLRAVKRSAESPNPFLNQIKVDETLIEINRKETTNDLLISTMTPSFVHCNFFIHELFSSNKVYPIQKANTLNFTCHEIFFSRLSNQNGEFKRTFFRRKNFFPFIFNLTKMLTKNFGQKIKNQRTFLSSRVYRLHL